MSKLDYFFLLCMWVIEPMLKLDYKLCSLLFIRFMSKRHHGN